MNKVAMEKDETLVVANNEQPSLSKRSALKAAWVAPLIVAVSLPRSGYAANISGYPRESKAKHDQGHHNSGKHKG